MSLVVKLGALATEGRVCRAHERGEALTERDILAFVDLNKRKAQRPIRVVKLERLAESQKIFVERARFLDVADVERDVGDSEYSRALRLRRHHHGPQG